MRLQVTNAAGRVASPSPDEVAAIVAVLQTLEDPAASAPPQPPSRWRKAARSFESERS